LEPQDFCREIEAYLCRKNDGHLIRVTGPSFEMVADWAAQGVPLKVAYLGIDRCFERYYRKGPRRRPVHIDFCAADVLDAFDQWRRALVLPASAVAVREPGDSTAAPETLSADRKRPSLPAHLERTLMRLTDARTSGALGGEADRLIDQVAEQLDVARTSPGGLRGERRQAVVERLNALDRDLLQAVRATLDAAVLRTIDASADEELQAFRTGMPADAFLLARQRVVDRLVRERFRLPVIGFLER
jgi:hypothetical protein